MRVCIRTRLTDDQNATSSTRQDARLSPTDKRGDETVITKSSENATMTFSGGFRGGPSRLRPPPLLGDGPTPSLMVMLANAKFWSFYCKTWYSEYRKWLPPVAFWQIVFGGCFAPDPAGETYSAPPDSQAGLRRPTFKGEGRGRRGEKEREGEMKGSRGSTPHTQIPGSALDIASCDCLLMHRTQYYI